MVRAVEIYQFSRHHSRVIYDLLSNQRLFVGVSFSFPITIHHGRYIAADKRKLASTIWIPGGIYVITVFGNEVVFCSIVACRCVCFEETIEMDAWVSKVGTTSHMKAEVKQIIRIYIAR